MNEPSPSELTERIVEKAELLGASMVGVADVEDAARALATSDEDARSLASTMNAFEEAAMTLPPGDVQTRYGVKYCRRCELSCPVGR